MKFTDVLSSELIHRGISKRDLARMAGIPEGTVYSWFSAKANAPSVDLAIKVAESLRVSLQYLTTGIGPMSEEDVTEHAGAFDGDFVTETSGRYEYPIPVERWVKRQESLMADLMELSDSELGTIAMMVRPLANQARESRKKTSAG